MRKFLFFVVLFVWWNGAKAQAPDPTPNVDITSDADPKAVMMPFTQVDSKPGQFCVCTENNPDFDGFRGAAPYRIAHCARNVSTSTKKRVYAIYGIPYALHSKYKIDHFIPLAIGGCNHIANLWPHLLNSEGGNANDKDKMEAVLYRALTNRKMTQEEAITKIRSIAW